MRKKAIIVVTALVVCAFVAVAVFSGDASAAALPSPGKLIPDERIGIGMSIEDFESVKAEYIQRRPHNGESYGLVDDVHTKISDLAVFRGISEDGENYEVNRMYTFPLNSIYPETNGLMELNSEEVIIQYGNEVSDEQMQEFVSLSEEYKAAFIEEFSLTDEIINEPYPGIPGNTPVISSLWLPGENIGYMITADICYDPQTGYFGMIYRSIEQTK